MLILLGHDYLGMRKTITGYDSYHVVSYAPSIAETAAIQIQIPQDNIVATTLHVDIQPVANKIECIQ